MEDRIKYRPTNNGFIINIIWSSIKIHRLGERMDDVVINVEKDIWFQVQFYVFMTTRQCPLFVYPRFYIMSEVVSIFI